jgi:signal transduction histidine kinase
MGTMTKLLNKPLRTFIVFTCLVLACSIPAYFYLIESIWLDELDDHNQNLKEQIQTRFNETNQADLEKKIALWNQIQRTSQISPTSLTRRDSAYIVEREMPDHGVMELERFRALFAVISLNGKPYSIIIETNVEEVHETVFAISIITCVFIVMLIIGFILLNRRLSKQIWAPFSDTLEKLKHFDLNNVGTINLKETDIQEFTELNETLIKLLNNNVMVYNQQKEFTQNASHELQTPLALLKSKIDLLIQDPSLTTSQRKIIDSLDSSVSRVTRINKNLLLLAGIENKKYEADKINLSELVKSLADNFVDFAEDKSCTISVNVKDGVSVKANESLVEILVSNLLSNTVRHGVANSEIDVTLNGKILIVSNEGKASLNENNLFKRFISATAHNPGTGLGLAIVKEICEKYGWRVTYTFTGNQHIFSVFF